MCEEPLALVSFLVVSFDLFVFARLNDWGKAGALLSQELTSDGQGLIRASSCLLGIPFVFDAFLLIHTSPTRWLNA